MQQAEVEAVKKAAAEAAADAVIKAKAAEKAEADAKHAKDMEAVMGRFEALAAEQEKESAADDTSRKAGPDPANGERAQAKSTERDSKAQRDDGSDPLGGISS